MTDMTDAQKAAGRKILRQYPALKVEIARNGDETTWTPYKTADVEQRGAEVTFTNGATPPSQIEREFATSCRILMEP